jgi:hypothetical protein
MTNPGVCYCGEYGGGVHTKSARCVEARPSNDLLDDAQGLICGIVGWLNMQAIDNPNVRALHAGLRQWLVTYADRATHEPPVVDPIAPVAQRMWIEGSDDSNPGWYEYDEIDVSTCQREGFEPLYSRDALRATQPPSDDTARLDWLTEQQVDTIYLDDGRIIDIGGHALTPHDIRRVIDETRSAPTKESGPPAMDTPVDGVPGMTIAEYMRAAVSSATKAGAENHCISGYWFCTNCQLCNSETIHHTSCPTCGSLRPTSGERDE